MMNDEIERLSKCLHALQAHPDFEYATTTAARKMGCDAPESGEGWEPNYDYRDGFERFDYHEEAYWRKRKQ